MRERWKMHDTILERTWDYRSKVTATLHDTRFMALAKVAGTHQLFGVFFQVYSTIAMIRKRQRQRILRQIGQNVLNSGWSALSTIQTGKQICLRATNQSTRNNKLLHSSKTTRNFGQTFWESRVEHWN